MRGVLRSRELLVIGIVVCGGGFGSAPVRAQFCEQEHKLLPADGVVDDLFGGSIALSGSTALIGSFRDDDNGNFSGAAYVFDVSTGTQEHKLLPNDGAMNDFFGFAVAIDGTRALIGAPGDSDNGFFSGSAYLFDLTTGNQIRKFTANGGSSSDNFGYAVALSGTTAIIGAWGDDDAGTDAGAVYLFDTTTGVQLDKITASDGDQDDRLGFSLAVDGNTAIAGARLDDAIGEFSGSAYLFDITTSAEIAKLTPNDGAAGDEFGYFVDIDGNTAVVGAIFDDDSGSESGSAYLFNATTGQQIRKLTAFDGAAEDLFGIGVAIEGDHVLIGSRLADASGEDSGAAYLFDTTTGDLISKIRPNDGESGDQFGNRVSISGNTALIGSWLNDDLGLDAGSAYVFDLTCDLCLSLSVSNLVAGERAVIRLHGGTPGVNAVTVYGTQAGQTIVDDVFGYCATFAIKDVTQSKVLGGLNRTFDSNGEIAFGVNIPGNVSGLDVLFQSAERGTCPEECVSNLVQATVQ